MIVGDNDRELKMRRQDTEQLHERVNAAGRADDTNCGGTIGGRAV